MFWKLLFAKFYNLFSNFIMHEYSSDILRTGCSCLLFMFTNKKIYEMYIKALVLRLTFKWYYYTLTACVNVSVLKAH